MKKLFVVVASILVSLSFGSTLNAAPSKSNIYHCGCNDDASGLEWQLISVSNRSRGHLNHVGGSFEECIDAEENVFVYERLDSDCRVDGTINLVDCDDPGTTDVDETPEAGTTCHVVAF
jgi:hypothetical protein